jgi:hypothetical protein
MNTVKHRLPIAVLLTNSQGTSAGVEIEEAYPVLLASELKDIAELHRICVGGWKINDFLNILDDNVLALRPEIVIVQAGIVECAQRVLTLFEKKLLRIIPLGRKISKWAHGHRAFVLKMRKRLGFAARVQSPIIFTSHVNTLWEKITLAGSQCIFIEIPKFADGGKDLRHPFINNDIEIFNAILRHYSSISCDTVVEKLQGHMYQPESVHFTREGHQGIASKLAVDLVELLKIKHSQEGMQEPTSHPVERLYYK